MPAIYSIEKHPVLNRGKAYTEQGGQLLLTARTATKTRTGHYPETKRAEIIRDLIDAQVEFFDNLPHAQAATVAFDNKIYWWNTWAEGLTLNTAKPLVTFNDQFYKGQTAATRKEYGKGSVTFLGVVTMDFQLEKDIIKDVFKRAAIPAKDYPEGVIIDWQNGMWIGVNYSDKPYTINKNNRNFLIGTNELKPAGVSVWKE